MEDGSTDYFTVGKKVKIDLIDMDYKTWHTRCRKSGTTNLDGSWHHVRTRFETSESLEAVGRKDAQSYQRGESKSADLLGVL